MNRFWQRYIQPIFETVQPRRIMEIGAEYGWNTRQILAFCRATGAHADIIDPAPHAQPARGAGEIRPVPNTASWR